MVAALDEELAGGGGDEATGAGDEELCGGGYSGHCEVEVEVRLCCDLSVSYLKALYS